MLDLIFHMTLKLIGVKMLRLSYVRHVFMDVIA